MKDKTEKLYCNKDLYMSEDDGNELAFKAGNSYDVVHINGTEICLKDEQGDEHFLGEWSVHFTDSTTPQPTAEGQRLSEEEIQKAGIWLSKQDYQREQGEQEYMMYFDVDIPKMLVAYHEYAAQHHNKGEKSMFKLPDYDKGYTDGVGDMKRDIAEGKWNKTIEKVIQQGECKTVPYQRCPICNGTGKSMNHDLPIPMVTDTCTTCNGKKIIPQFQLGECERVSKPTVLVKVTKKFEVDPKRPRPKWWDNYVGETFECYDECEGWWNLAPAGHEKLSKLKGSKSISAIINKNCGEIVNVTSPITKEQIVKVLREVRNKELDAAIYSKIEEAQATAIFNLIQGGEREPSARQILNEFTPKIYEVLLKPPFNLEHSQHGAACDKIAEAKSDFLKTLSTLTEAEEIPVIPPRPPQQP